MGIAVACGESFTASTGVLLASGAAVPISALKPGDKVLATNVKTGKTQPETVAAVLVHHDTDLYNLKVKTGHRTTVIHTTANHLFWDTYLHQWIAAAKLKKGEQLKTADGTLATAAGGYTPRITTGWMWDLTIPTDHDFYIDTELASVLVHNCPRPTKANSYKSLNGGTFRTRGQAMQAAQQEQQDYVGMRTVVREECSSGCHIHLDIYNKAGQLLRTIHYTYQNP